MPLTCGFENLSIRATKRGTRVKRILLWAIIFLSIPGSATISQVQSKPNWACSGTSCAATFTLNPTTGNLIAVWTFWQSTSSFTASVGDTCPQICSTYVSAVGPTFQPATTPTGCQIFYAKNIQNLSNHSDTVTVSFSGTGTISSAGVVIVEYSGLDTMYPLDSVSAGYSSSGNATSLLDSGTVAPANSNLLVFGGGVIDSGTAGAGSGFTSIQAHAIGTGSGITEQNASAITGNNVLQRATASLTGVGTGNWLMQMAVFRDASSTVAGGWNPIRITQVLDATQFPGTDIGAQINAAYNSSSCPSVGCHIRVPARSSCYPYLNPIIFAVSGKPVLLEGDPNGMSCIQYTGTTTGSSAVTLDWGNNLLWSGGVRDVQLVGPDSTVSVTGLQLTNVNGLTGALVSGVTIYGFQNCVNEPANSTTGTNNVTFDKVIVGTSTASCNVAFNFGNLGENFVITNSAISGPSYGVVVSNARRPEDQQNFD
jgi:hypothetical protein